VLEIGADLATGTDVRNDEGLQDDNKHQVRGACRVTEDRFSDAPREPRRMALPIGVSPKNLPIMAPAAALSSAAAACEATCCRAR
jgi:hypothetical protein